MMQDTKTAAEGTKSLADTGVQAVHQVKAWTDTATFYAVEYGPRVLGVLLVLMVSWVASRWVRRMVLTGLTKARFDTTLAKFFANMTRWVVLLLAVLACLETFGIKSTSLAAVVGAAGLAIALGFQGTLGNLAAGVLLLVFRPFKIGDSVIVAGQTGVIDGIDLFTTNLDTGDFRRIIIPNGSIFNAIIENTSHHPRRCASVNIVVAATADLDRTRELLTGAAERVAGSRGGLREPAPAVALSEVMPAVTWTVSVWAETGSFAGVRQALLREVKVAVDGAGIGPGAPTMNVNIQSMPKGPGGA